MLVSDIIRKAQRRFGDSDQIIATNADWFDWINEAQLEIIVQTGEQTNSLITNASLIPIDLTASKVISIKKVTYGTRVLDLTNEESIDALRIDNTFTGEPYQYYISHDNRLTFFPDPPVGDLTAVVAEYSGQPIQVTLVGDTPSIPFVYHEDIVTWCVMRANERVQNYRAMDIAKTMFDEKIGARSNIADRRDETYPVIRDDPWDDV